MTIERFLKNYDTDENNEYHLKSFRASIMAQRSD